MAENNENKRGITEKEALETARDFLADANVEEFAETIEKLDKMIEQRATVKREYKPNAETLEKGNKFMEEWTADEWTSEDVRIVLGLEKAQQANGVCSVMVKNGLWAKKPTTRSVAVYERA